MAREQQMGQTKEKDPSRGLKSLRWRKYQNLWSPLLRLSYVFLNDWLLQNTDRTKLYFLLDEVPTTFNEDDDRFRNFFENRYISLAVKLRKELPEILKETMQWLNNEVFDQQANGDKAIHDEEQDAFEEDLDHEIAMASKESKHRRMEAIEMLQDQEIQLDEGLQSD